MAGIGFELRKILAKGSLLSVLRAFSYASVIISGPWLLSIVGIILISMFSLTLIEPRVQITQFQTSVTYLIALSMILTGPIQLTFTRFTADCMFEHRSDWVLPNYHAVVLLVTVITGVAALLGVTLFLSQQSITYQILMVVGFVIVSNIWIAAIFLTSMKQYKQILWTFFIGYGVTVLGSLGMHRYGLDGLLFGFVIGQLVLLVGLSILIYRVYQSDKFISFEAFQGDYIFFSLIPIGLFYNLGIWIDKFIFWHAEGTGQQVIGPLHASIIYDFPIFLAYLTIIPGMAVFLVRVETDFAEYYQAFFDAVRGGTSLDHIERMRNRMVQTIYAGLYEIVKIQAMVAVLLFTFGGAILRALGFSELYLPVLFVDIVAASLQVLFLATLNIFFYLDYRRIVLMLTVLVMLLNGLLSWLTLNLDPRFYGYGFTGAMLIMVMVSVYTLDKKLNLLEFETYTKQKFG